MNPGETDQAFLEAAASVATAQAGFAEDKERFGPAVALAYFNARVLRWAQQFSNPRLARVMYVTGCTMDGADHSYAISVNGNIRGGNKGDRHKVVRGSLMYRYLQTYCKAAPGDKPRTISYPQFHRLLAMAEANGVSIITREQQPRQGPDGEHPGARQPSIISVDFSRVLKNGQVVPHNFGAKLEHAPSIEDYARQYAELNPPADPQPAEPQSPIRPPRAKNDTGYETGRETRRETGDDTHSYVPDVSSGCTNEASVHIDASSNNTKTSDKSDRSPLPGHGAAGPGANAPSPAAARVKEVMEAREQRKEGFNTRINTYMIRPGTGYYYRPGDNQAKKESGDVRVVLSPGEGMELFDRDVNPTQKDRMAFMKGLYQARHEEKVDKMAARIRAERDAEIRTKGSFLEVPSGTSGRAWTLVDPAQPPPPVPASPLPPDRRPLNEHPGKGE